MNEEFKQWGSKKSLFEYPEYSYSTAQHYKTKLTIVGLEKEILKLRGQRNEARDKLGTARLDIKIIEDEIAQRNNQIRIALQMLAENNFAIEFATYLIIVKHVNGGISGYRSGGWIAKKIMREHKKLEPGARKIRLCT